MSPPSALVWGGLPRTVFSGDIDMLVVPSIAPESFGLVVAEAMSARVPVIVSDAGALSEVLGGASYPYVVPADQPVALAQAIKSLGTELREDTDALAERTSELFWRWQENYSPEAGKVRVVRFWNVLSAKVLLNF